MEIKLENEPNIFILLNKLSMIHIYIVVYNIYYIHLNTTAHVFVTYINVSHLEATVICDGPREKIESKALK